MVDEIENAVVEGNQTAAPESSSQTPVEASDVAASITARSSRRKLPVAGAIVAGMLVLISLPLAQMAAKPAKPSAVDQFNASRPYSKAPTDNNKMEVPGEPKWAKYRSKDSEIKSYKYEADYLKLKYKDGTIVDYTAGSVGKERLSRMKDLAKDGKGLDKYISENAEGDYAEKHKCSD